MVQGNAKIHWRQTALSSGADVAAGAASYVIDAARYAKDSMSLWATSGITTATGMVFDGTVWTLSAMCCQCSPRTRAYVAAAGKIGTGVMMGATVFPGGFALTVSGVAEALIAAYCTNDRGTPTASSASVVDGAGDDSASTLSDGGAPVGQSSAPVAGGLSKPAAVMPNNPATPPTRATGGAYSEDPEGPQAPLLG